MSGSSTAKRAMTDVGLDGDSAAADIRELHGLLEAFTTAKHTAWPGSVRPVIIYAFFLVFAVVRVLALAALLQTDGTSLAAALQGSWDEVTQAPFAAVMSFWFGSCQISKMHQGG